MKNGFGVGWRQVACCFFLLTCSGFISSSYSILAVALGKAFHPSRMVLMLTMTIMAAGSGLLSPFVGSLMDRASMRKVMVAGALLLATGYAAMSFTTSFNQVLILFGLFIAPANVLIGTLAITVLISRWFTKRRGTAIGIAISGVAAGTLLYPPILQSFFVYFDWRTGFQLFGLMLLVIGLPAALLVVDRPALRGLHPDGAPSDPAAPKEPAPAPVSVRTILTDPAFWLATGIFTAVVSGTKGMVTNLAPMAIDVGVDPRRAALLLSIYGACGFTAKLSFAVIADRIPTRILMFLSLIGFTTGMLLLSQARFGFWMIAAGVGCVGLAGGVMVPMQSYLVPRIFGAHCVGRAFGLMSTVQLIFLLSTPPLFGRIFDITGSYSAIYLTFILLTVGSMIAVPFLRLHARPSLTEMPPPEVLPLAA